MSIWQVQKQTKQPPPFPWKKMVTWIPRPQIPSTKQISKTLTVYTANACIE